MQFNGGLQQQYCTLHGKLISLIVNIHYHMLQERKLQCMALNGDIERFVAAAIVPHLSDLPCPLQGVATPISDTLYQGSWWSPRQRGTVSWSQEWAGNYVLILTLSLTATAIDIQTVCG